VTFRTGHMGLLVARVRVYEVCDRTGTKIFKGPGNFVA
jgi:hypothetical protein